jgi:4-hydroxy-tetrahydrodipicolinate synthase
VLGTTAETITLTDQEQQLVIDTVVAENNSRVPLVLGMGGSNTHALVQKIKATDFSHFDAILSVTPYYNKPTQEGLKAHFSEVANAAPIPVILYNVPSRTGVNMLPKTTLEIAHSHPNVIGIKEAKGDMEQIAQLLSSKPEGFLVVSGDDATAYQTTLAGGSGVISVIGQAIPAQFSDLIHSALKGYSSEANRLNEQLQDLIEAIFEEGNPCGVKALMNILDSYPLQVRLPLVPASVELQNKLKNSLGILGSLVS